MNASPLKVAALIFPRFELLDLFGPLELLGLLKDDVTISLVAQVAAPVASNQGPKTIPDLTFEQFEGADVLLVPGGMGTRQEVDNAVLTDWLRTAATRSKYITSVCTGSALLARAGLLDGKRATSNKRAFEWVKSQGPAVHWIPKARWVEDGNIFTSSGISAGMDMTLGLLARLYHRDISLSIAAAAEYIWNEDSANDPFAEEN
jgi:putative intracellular protease/amidase